MPATRERSSTNRISPNNGKPVAENHRTWQDLRNKGWTAEDIANIHEKGQFTPKTILNATSAPVQHVPGVDVKQAVAAATRLSTPKAEQMPLTHHNWMLDGWLAQYDVYDDPSDVEQAKFLYGELTALDTAITSRIKDMAALLHGVYGEATIPYGDRKFEIGLTTPSVRFDEEIEHRLMETAAHASTADEVVDLAMSVRSPGWKPGALLDAGVNVERDQLATVTPGPAGIVPDSACMAKMLGYFDRYHIVNHVHPIHTPAEHVEHLAEAFDLRRHVRSITGPAAQLVAANQPVGSTVVDFESRTVGRVVDGSRYTGWDHRKVRDLIVSRYEDDPRRAMRAYLTVSPRRYKRQAIADVFGEEVAARCCVRTPGRPVARETTGS